MEWFVFTILVSMLIGTVLTTIVLYRLVFKPVGTLRIDRSNPDKDVYRIDLGENFERSVQKRIIALSVDNDADLSQK